MTGHSHDYLDVSDIDELGAVDFLIKPVAPSLLRAKISALLRLRATSPDP